MEARKINCAWLVICFILLTGVQLTSAEKCKFKEKYVCGNEDCNCRYVSPSIFSLSSLYKRFSALVSRQNYEGNICDKCDVFCSKEKNINCYRGACDKQKGCVCRNCWSGETCSKYENENNPVFQEQTYTANINEEVSVGEQILQVTAFDSDLEMCVDKENCPCGKIQYSITKGNKQQYFSINQETGVLSLNRELIESNYVRPFILHIKADNNNDENTPEDENSRSVTVVTISVGNGRQSVVRKRRSTHHRSRRSTKIYDKLITTFIPETNMTFFAAGCIINFRLFLMHNKSDTPTDLTSMVVTLSSTNLDIDKSSMILNISGSQKGNTSVQNTDSNTLEFNVNENLDVNDYIELRFKATVRNTVQPLSALQVAFSLKASNLTNSTQYQYGPTYSTIIYAAYPRVTFARTSHEAISVETTLEYNVNVTLPYLNFSLIFEISTTVNQIRFLSVENVEIRHISSTLSPSNPNPSPVRYTGAEDNVTSRVVMDFGKIEVNDKTQSVNTMMLVFFIKVNDHYLLENASLHWVGVGIRSGEEMLWVGQERITVFKDEPFLIAEITTLNKTSPTRYYMNDELYFSWHVTHSINASYATAKNVKISLLVSNFLEIQDAAIVQPASKVSLPDSSGRTGYMFTLNDANFSQSSSASGNVHVKVKNNGVTPLSDLNMEIKLYYQTPDGVDRPIKTYRPNPGYLSGTPTFNLSSNNVEKKLKVGQVVEIYVHIVVKEILLRGVFEVILPVKNKSAIMRYVPESFAVMSTGSNINSTLPQNSVVTNSTVNHTTYFDRATFNVGTVRNKNLAISDTKENTLEIKFQALLEDHEYITNGTKYWVAVGVTGGPNMVWIGEIAFVADIPLVRRPRLLFNPTTNGTNSMMQGDVVQYNFTISHDNISNAHAQDVEVLWMMPAYTKFVEVSFNSHNMQRTQPNNNIMFKLQRLDFLETYIVSFLVQLDPLKTLKPGKNFAVTPVSLTYKNSKKSETFFEPLVPMSVSFKVPTPPPHFGENAVKEFYNRGFLVDNTSSAIYICKVSKQRNKPSCFWTNTKGSVWRAVNLLVINIIGVDNGNKIVYGIGNNKKAYMKYLPEKGRWFSISSDNWLIAKPTLSDQIIVSIEDGYNHEGNPEASKQHDVGNGEKWGADNIGIHFYTPTNGWSRKAMWDCCQN